MIQDMIIHHSAKGRMMGDTAALASVTTCHRCRPAGHGFGHGKHHLKG